MLRLMMATIIMVAMAPGQLHATSKTVCTNWGDVNETVTIGGTKQNCKRKRRCTTTETGTCEKIFGCSTTIQDQYDQCTKAAAGLPGILRESQGNLPMLQEME